jgi:poly(3-hydroxybutyrate) depolymerase
MVPMRPPIALLLLLTCPALQAQDPWWSAPVEASLARAEAARPVWEDALNSAPADQREGLAFLIEHMPRQDLRTLAPEMVLENVALAYEVRARVPWGEALPREVFLEGVLPYANVSEARDRWRPGFVEQFLPLVAECKTPAEAALVLNRKVFPAIGLRYSTTRRAPDQGPFESIELGVASCTGLSIVLADACRAVGVPARLAGIASWPNKQGNHTWVEVWDSGAWHFLGAAEPDGRGLDHAWFSADAALAQEGSREHGVWAVSTARTAHTFPMVWTSADTHPEVFAVDVSARYVNPLQAPDPELCRLLVRVVDSDGRRTLRRVRVLAADDSSVEFVGQSRRENADLNDILAFEVPRGRRYLLQFAVGRGWRTVREVTVSPQATQFEVELVAEQARDSALRTALIGWFRATPEQRAAIEFNPHFRLRLVQEPAAVRTLAFEAWLESDLHDDLARNAAQGLVKWRGRTSPYTLKEVGDKPAGGWPLVIALHGGGGVPKEVNDSQWRHMQIYYHDHPEVGGYKYLALRAPNDNWNGFYDDSISGLVERLVRQMVTVEEVNPERVSLIGYSHGGYGAFVIGTKIPQRFAVVHASAAGPTPGETSAQNLRNTPFSFMCGEKDSAYGRIERCREFAGEVRALKGDRDDVFPVTYEEQAGFGHGGLPDRDKTLELVPHLRNPVPKELTWRLTDTLLEDFYWLHVSQPRDGQISATIEGNHITVNRHGLAGVALYLDGRLVDLARPVTVQLEDGASFELQLNPDLELLCETLESRGDPGLAFSVRVELDELGR